jgi:hypothetical protein
MKQISAILLVLLLSHPSGLFAMSRRAPVHTSHPVVSDVTGSVMVKGQGQQFWEPVERGTLLFPNDVIRSSFGSRASIRFPSGAMELYEDTELQISSSGVQERKKDISEVSVRSGSVLLDIRVDKAFEFLIFRTGSGLGKAAYALLTVSYLGAGTAVNVYRGEARVLSSDGSHQTMTSLVPGSSLRVERADKPGNLVRFDPRAGQKNYMKGILPRLDEASGLFIKDGQAAGAMERSRAAGSRTRHVDSAEGAVIPMSLNQDFL